MRARLILSLLALGFAFASCSDGTPETANTAGSGGSEGQDAPATCVPGDLKDPSLYEKFEAAAQSRAPTPRERRVAALTLALLREGIGRNELVVSPSAIAVFTEAKEILGHYPELVGVIGCVSQSRPQAKISQPIPDCTDNCFPPANELVLSLIGHAKDFLVAKYPSGGAVDEFAKDLWEVASTGKDILGLVEETPQDQADLYLHAAAVAIGIGGIGAGAVGAPVVATLMGAAATGLAVEATLDQLGDAAAEYEYCENWIAKNCCGPQPCQDSSDSGPIDAGLDGPADSPSDSFSNVDSWVGDVVTAEDDGTVCALTGTFVATQPAELSKELCCSECYVYVAAVGAYMCASKPESATYNTCTNESECCDGTLNHEIMGCQAGQCCYKNGVAYKNTDAECCEGNSDNGICCTDQEGAPCSNAVGPNGSPCCLSAGLVCWDGQCRKAYSCEGWCSQNNPAPFIPWVYDLGKTPHCYCTSTCEQYNYCCADKQQWCP